jgi:type I restriction enzyme S subunit
VKFIELGTIAEVATGTRPSNDELNLGGPFDYMNGGVVRSGSVPRSNFDGEAITIPSRGSVGQVGFQTSPFWCGPLCYRINSKSGEIETKFLYFALKNIQSTIVRLQQTGSIPALNKKQLISVRVPIPPLEVQWEIVRVLDLFQSLEAELEAELEARRRQYAHYADLMLTSGLSAGEFGDVEFASVGDICRINRGRVMSRDYLRDHPGPYPVYSSQTADEGVFGYIDSFDYDFESITWTTDGANAGSLFFHSGESFSITNVCGLLQVIDTSLVNAKFLYYVLGRHTMRHVSSGMGNPKLMSNVMARIQLPIPPIEEQERLVKILDSLSALSNDLSVGLPAELNARRQQYEYYRNRLLTFEKAA